MSKKHGKKAIAGGKVKRAVLVFIMLATAALAVCFALSPMIEKNRMLERQAELLDSIERGGGTIIVDETFAAVELDFYDDDGGSAPDTDTFPAGLESAMPEPEAVTEITGIGVLTIERIDAKLPVTEGVSEAQLNIAVGHVPQTSEIGASGNAVVAGHRSYAYGQFFNRLSELETGDIIAYQPKDGDVMEFEVCEILEVLPGDPAVLWQPKDKQVLTLYTCTPIRTATHRLLVRAMRVI